MIQEFYSRLSDKEKKVFCAAAAVLLLALMDRLFLSPVLSRLSTLDQAISGEEQNIKRDLRLLAYQERILEEDKASRRFYLKEPKTEEEIIAAFLKRIEILATEAGVNLARVTPADNRPQKGYIKYSANLECSGTLAQVVSFIHLIDTADELLRVERISLSPRRGNSEEITGTMTVAKIVIRSNGPAENPVEPAAAPGS